MVASTVQSASSQNASPVNNNTPTISQNGFTNTPVPTNKNTTPVNTSVPTNVVPTNVVPTDAVPTISVNSIGDPGSFLSSLQGYLVNSPLLKSNNGDNDNVVDQIQEINNSMNNIANAISSNNSANVLSQQMGMQTIIDQEMKRLNQKKQNIESAMTTQERMMILNDSFLKRQKMFSRIALAVVIGMSLIFIFRYFSINNPDLESLANVLSIFVIVTVFIYSMWTYIAILRRDPIYFDQLSYIPDKNTPGPTSSVMYSSGYGGSGLVQSLTPKECVGSDCCSVEKGTIWDSTTNSCIANSNATRT